MTTKTNRRLLVTNALPYANGSIHMGHLLGYIGADIWVRAMRAMGHDVIYVCADDAHGTAIMLKAADNGISPKEQIRAVQQEHMADFADFFVDFDHYDSTDSDTNRALVNDIYLKNQAAGNITVRPVTQLFDTEKEMFLSDRFVKGECPKCTAADQYGDNCEVCGTTYNATELINPKSTLSGATPIQKTSDHYFFKLTDFSQFLTQWTKDENRLPASIANKLDEWFKTGLSDWDISRDAPYFGFQIPDAKDKYFYVWVDAPVGYMASFKNYIDKHRPDVSFDDYWDKDANTEVYHFIGKDIVYFHALFWPAMLTGANYRTPTSIFVNGFLTVNGAKMSKSRGTFIKARTYLDHLDPEYLRYYFASKLSDTIQDNDLNLDDFVAKVNADLVGKVVNIASRCAKFINTQFDNRLSKTCDEPELLAHFVKAGDDIIAYYEKREFGCAIREIMTLADKANQYIDEQKPWSLAKEGTCADKVQSICSVGLNLFYQLIIYLAPVLPNTAKKVATFLNVAPITFEARHTILTDHTISPFSPLMQRIDPKKIAQMRQDATQTQDDEPKQNAPKKENNKPTEQAIGIDDFAKVVIKVAYVQDCQKVAGADKLLQFTLDIGEPNLRNVFSGIAKFYEPETLVGKKVLCVTNLAPRKMKFGVSEGMILSTEKDGKVTLVVVDDGLSVGGVLA